MGCVLSTILGATMMLAMNCGVDIRVSANEIERGHVQTISTSMIGDLNGDNEVTDKDDELFKKYFAGGNVAIPNFDVVTDINEDGRVTRKDAMILVRRLAVWKEYASGTDVNPNSKSPEDFTAEDYNKLTLEEKALFPDYFDSMDAYWEWYNRVIAKNDSEPDVSVPGVDLNGKRPEDFTEDDYNRLTPEEKVVFPDCFDSMEDYNEWYNRVFSNGTDTETPDSVPGVDLNGKRPEEFTVEDYNNLTPEEKALFPDYFESMDAYLEWYDRVIGD